MNDPSPPVTIGMPVYNGAAFLERALGSILEQTYRNYRVVISDNGSTDGSGEIIRRMVGDDPRFIVHRQDRTLPPIENFRFVLRAADTDLFIFLAYDDWWSPDGLARLVRLFVERPGLDLAVMRGCRCPPDGSQYLRRPFVEPRMSWAPLRARHFLRTSQSGWFYGLHRRASLIEAFDFAPFPQSAWGWDFALLAPILLRGRVAGANDATFYQYLTGISEERLRPSTPQGQRRLFREFTRRCRLALRLVYPGLGLRLLLLPTVIRYANDHAWKIRKLLTDLIRSRTAT